MDKKESQEAFARDYNPAFGVAIPRPLVPAPTENKHGIDNPVIDLNIPTASTVQDQIGSLLTDTDTVDLNYNGAASPPTITADVRRQKSITADANGLELVGDAATPGNSKYYGTDASGVKGFHTASATPGGTDRQLQFNDASSFGGTKVLYEIQNPTSIRFKLEDQTTIDDPGNTFTLYGSLGNGAGAGGDLDFFAGWDEGDLGFGAELWLPGVAPSGKPDDAYIGGAFPADGDGGDVALKPATAFGTGTIPGHAKISDAVSGENAIFETGAISADRTYAFPDQDGTFATVTSGIIAPASTPAAVGQIYVDTIAIKVYISTGIASSADWTVLN